MSRSRPPVLLISLLALLALAFGCKEETATRGQTAAQKAGSPDAAAEARVITLYSGRSEALVAPLIEKFEEQSGVTVKVKYGGSGELAGTILEEGKRSPADVFWAQDAGTLGVLTKQGLLNPLPDQITDLVGEHYRAPEDSWVATSGRARVLVYNTEKLKEGDLPASVKDLTKPEWKGRVGWAPENSSFQAFVAAMVELEGVEAAEAWVAAMQANEPKSYPKNTPAVAATASGEVDVALVNHYYLLRMKAEHGEDYPAANHFFKDASAASLVNVSGVGVLASAKNTEAAQQFVGYLLSDEAQSYFAKETFEYPVVESVAPSKGLVPLKELNPPKVNFTKLANLETTVELLRKTKALP